MSDGRYLQLEHGPASAAPTMASLQTKNGPRFRRGPSCLGSLALRELGWRPDGGVAVGAQAEPRGRMAAYYGCSAPPAALALWGDADARAAKLFSISTRCTVLLRTRSGF